MCGLAGIAKLGTGGFTPSDQSALAAMAEAVAHRGPDAQRTLVADGVGLAFRRLALVGPDSGDQPLYSADQSVVLIANGEVYNHRELEARLGVQPRTNSDCEILAHLYAERGLRFLDDVVGMFSLVLWDRRAHRLVLARDRFAIKPLFYSRVEDAVLVASEIKGLLAHPACTSELDWVGALADQSMNIGSYLTDEPVQTWFRDIETVQAGQILTIDLRTGAEKKHQYWRMPDFRGDADMSDTEFVDAYRTLLSTAVADAATADAELGLFLSGGVDSAAVGALARAATGRTFHTFTVLSGSTLANGDAEFAHRVAASLGLPNHQVEFDLDTVPGVAEWKRLLWLLETPLCTAEQFYKYELYRYAKRERPELRGMLLGAGSDEFNGGFSTVFGEGWAGFEAAMDELARATVLRERPGLAPWWHHREAPLISDDLLRHTGQGPDTDPYPRYVAWRSRHMQQYNNWHEDRTAAGNGVEARVPFLDHRLVELLAQIPPHRRSALLWDKRIVRDAVRHVLPDIVADRPKVPFYYGTGVGSTQHVMVRMLAQEGDALLEEALASPGGQRFLRPDAMRDMLRRLEREPEPWDFEYLLRMVNLGLLDQMARELPTPPAQVPAYRIMTSVPVEDWDRDSAAVATRIGQRPQLAPDGVVEFAEDVLLVHEPDAPERLYIAVDGAFEFVVDRDDNPDWWGFLRAVDGKKTFAELLEDVSDPQDAVVDMVREAIESRVLTVGGR